MFWLTPVALGEMLHLSECIFPPHFPYQDGSQAFCVCLPVLVGAGAGAGGVAHMLASMYLQLSVLILSLDT